MSEPFIAEVRIFGFNFAPKGWAQCNGQLMSIAQNTALFSLVGTMYGGDGKVTFGLPNLQGAVPLGADGATFYPGTAGGAAQVTLTTPQLPAHTHQVNCNSGTGNAYGPPGNIWATEAAPGINEYAGAAAQGDQMNAAAIAPAGNISALPHDNIQPYLSLNYCIALTGIFPSRP